MLFLRIADGQMRRENCRLTVLRAKPLWARLLYDDIVPFMRLAKLISAFMRLIILRRFRDRPASLLKFMLPNDISPGQRL